MTGRKRDGAPTSICACGDPVGFHPIGGGPCRKCGSCNGPHPPYTEETFAQWARRVTAEEGDRPPTPSLIQRALFVSAIVILIVSASSPVARAWTPLPIGGPIEPTPQLEGSATFNFHGAAWPDLAYQTSSGAEPILPASVRSTATGSYFIDPIDIQAPGVLQGESVGGANWALPASWSQFPGVNGSVATGPTAVQINGQTAIQSTLNSSAAGQQPGVGLRFAWWVPGTNYPSTNTAFDWITVAYSFAGPSCPVSGQCYATPFLTNLSPPNLLSTGLYVYPNGQERQYFSNPGDGSAPFNVHEGHTGYASFSIGYLSSGAGGFNATGKDAASQVYFSLEIFLPAGTPKTYTLTVYAFALTSAPMLLGTSPYGASSINRETFLDTLNLSALAPTFSYSGIVAGGYRVAIAQRAQDLAPGQVQIAYLAVSKGSYVEEVTYNFQFGLPSDPSLAYSSMNLTDEIGVPAGQYVGASYNGSSLLTLYQAAKLSTRFNLLTIPVPTIPGAWVATVDYTSSQWTEIMPTGGGGSGFLGEIGSAIVTFLQTYWYVIAIVVGGVVLISAITSEDRRARRHGGG